MAEYAQRAAYSSGRRAQRVPLRDARRLRVAACVMRKVRARATFVYERRRHAASPRAAATRFCAQRAVPACFAAGVDVPRAHGEGA